MSAADLIAWLAEREANARAIAASKTDPVDRAGWLEDAEYFAKAIVAAGDYSAGYEHGHADATREAITDHAAAPKPGAGWRPIAEAPKNKTILVGYWNSHGHWRTLRASYYAKGELPLSDDCLDDDDGFAPEGWYEETYTHEIIMPLECDPVMWHPLPAAPTQEQKA